jgi:hypothetical protein
MKPVPAPLCPPQIPHRLIQAQTQALIVRGWQQTTCSIARPKQLYCAIFAMNEDITSYNKAAIT